ncbi:MAG TPA: hypothetical protein VIJ88_01350 [Candidatus Paceibacterota bacterium]
MHHAYFYEGPLSLLGELAVNARALFNFEGDNNPDVVVRSFPKFGIDDSQALRALASFKSTSGRALFVVGTAFITSEAQQALLKLFEEPAPGSIFVLLVPHGALIATLRSRMMTFPQLAGEPRSLGSLAPKLHTYAGKFLADAYKARSAAVTVLLKDEEDAKERVRELLLDLEAELHGWLQKTNGKKEYVEALEDIAQVRSYVGDRSPSLKMLLEHLAATLPQI